MGTIVFLSLSPSLASLSHHRHSANDGADDGGHGHQQMDGCSGNELLLPDGIPWKGVCTGLGRRYCIVQERSVTFRYHILLIDSISDQITTTDWENSLLPFFSGCPFSTNCRISNNLRRRRRWRRRRDRKKSTAETTSGFRKKSHVQPTDGSTDLTSPLYPPSSADFDMVTTFHR